jgi:DNA-directed RNA polymerase subunit K/omega
MIRKKQLQEGPIVIDLTGPDGNAFALMAYASRFAKQLGMDSKSIIEEMKSGDYENLLQVFDKHFGDYIILER